MSIISWFPGSISVIQWLMFTLQGDFGPFNPSMQTSVPLWLALNLKQRQKCRIEPPSWLSVGNNTVCTQFHM